MTDDRRCETCIFWRRREGNGQLGNCTVAEGITALTTDLARCSDWKAKGE